MSTKFPSFAADTTEELWFNVDNPCDDEAELQAEEQKYQNWVCYCAFISLGWFQCELIFISQAHSYNVYCRCLNGWILQLLKEQPHQFNITLTVEQWKSVVACQEMCHHYRMLAFTDLFYVWYKLWRSGRIFLHNSFSVAICTYTSERTIPHFQWLFILKMLQ